MYPELIKYLACPIDHHGPLDVEGFQKTPEGEIAEGLLHCSTCARTFPIRESIPCFVEHSDVDSAEEGANRWKADEQKMRDLLARNYDSRIPDRVVSAELMGLMYKMNLASNHGLLDVGCGTGRITMSLAKLARVTVASDFSLASLKIFRDRIPVEWKRRVHLVQADAFHLPFRERAFDRIVSNGVFEHLPALLEDRSPVWEAARVLVNDGVFVVSIYNYSMWRVLMTRLFPTVTYGGGYDREGFHAGKIYFRRYRWSEINALLKESFEVAHIGGTRIVPKEILKRGGTMALRLERAFQRLPVSKFLGYYVLAVGRKRI